MNLYIWRHNKTYHSHSMINEPCVVNEFYLDALAIVEAETLDDALKLLEERKEPLEIINGEIIPALNVVGDSACAMAVAKSEKALDEERYRA